MQCHKMFTLFIVQTGFHNLTCLRFMMRILMLMLYLLSKPFRKKNFIYTILFTSLYRRRPNTKKVIITNKLFVRIMND